MPAVTPISALPPFVSLEQHKDIVSSTPPSLSKIPPVLRHKQDDVCLRFDPPLADILPEAKGSLYVIESVLAFIDPTSGTGFQVDYRKITLHAITRAESGPKIYLQLDEQDENQESDAVEDEEDTPMRELTITPSDPKAVDAIFEALSHCASLHPDSQSTDGDNDAIVDGSELDFEVFTGGPEEELSEVGRVRSNLVNNNRYQPY